MGQVIAGRFELHSHIAAGGSGTIWRAWDSRRGDWCAAKVLRQKDSAALLRFVREQGIQLDHEHLATPYGWAAEDEDVAIAMPLVSGGTLGEALKAQGAFSSALTAQLLLQLLDGLSHVHAAGWIHRDVKPANILLEPTGEGAPHLRLGDFGIAIREDDPRLTSMGWVNGTPGYLAPEVMDLAAPAPAQDLYSAGVVALRMLDPTIVGDKALTQALLVPRRTLQRIPGVDPRLVSVVASLLDEDPEDRLSAARRAPGLLRELARPTTPGGGYLTAAGTPFTVQDAVTAASATDTPAPAEKGGQGASARTAQATPQAPPPAPRRPAPQPSAPTQNAAPARDVTQTQPPEREPEPEPAENPEPAFGALHVPVDTDPSRVEGAPAVAAQPTPLAPERPPASSVQRGAEVPGQEVPGQQVGSPAGDGAEVSTPAVDERPRSAVLPWVLMVLGLLLLAGAALLLWPR